MDNKVEESFILRKMIDDRFHVLWNKEKSIELKGFSLNEAYIIYFTLLSNEAFLTDFSNNIHGDEILVTFKDTNTESTYKIGSKVTNVDNEEVCVVFDRQKNKEHRIHGFDKVNAYHSALVFIITNKKYKYLK